MRRRLLAARATGGALLAVVLAGCPGRPPPVEAPQIRVERLNAPARGVPGDGGELAATLTVTSRDRRAIRLDAIDWTLAGPSAPPRRGRLLLGDVRLAPGEVRTLTLPLPATPGLLAVGDRFRLSATVHARGAGGPLAIAAVGGGVVAGAAVAGGATRAP
jgi:hypothetical protein